MTTLTKLGKYKLDAIPVGQGAMGVVYKAFDPDLRQTVAIKVIRRELLEDVGEQNWRQRFKNEAIAGRRLRHPNIVPVYDYGEEDDCSYIVMGFVEGRPLREVLRSGHRFSIPEALSVMEQLLDALDHAHGQKVVHRDIKPANVLVGEDGQLQVADFGIAKIDVAGLTRTGAVMGTPGYMSPEQCQGLPSDQRADIFAAGVILYELLTGERPFRANVEVAALQQVLSPQPVKPSELNLDVPLAIDQVVAKAMATRREERFPSAREFAVALERAVRTGPTPAADVQSMPTITDTVPVRGDQRPRNTGKSVLATAAVAESHTVAYFSDPQELASLVRADASRTFQDHSATRAQPRHDTRPADQRGLRVLFENVRGLAEDVLKREPNDAALLPLDKAWTGESLDHPWDAIVERLGTTPERIPREKRIVELFNQVGQSLLILGEPGSGKTTALIQLASGLIAQMNPGTLETVPVVVNLSSWNRAYLNFASWLTREIADKYRVPEKASAAWFEDGRLVLLLDGLDEVSDGERAACAMAINHIRNVVPSLGLAVCSRSREYHALPVKLRLLGAVRIEPLTTDQVDEYFSRAGSKLAVLRSVWIDDPALQTLATSPFMLDIMSRAYADASPDALASPRLGTVEARRKHLFDTYVNRMFEHRPAAAHRDTKEQTVHWLSWLARKMLQHSQSEFLIEQLQPSWLASRGLLFFYTVCLRLLVISPLFMILILLPSSWLFRNTTPSGPNPEQMAHGVGTIVAIAMLLVIITDAVQFLLSSKAQELRPPAPLWKKIAWIAIFAVLVSLATWSVTADPILASSALGGGIGAGLLCIRRSCVLSTKRDVYMVDALTWSGTGALKGSMGALSVTFGLLTLMLALVFYQQGVFAKLGVILSPHVWPRIQPILLNMLVTLLLPVALVAIEFGVILGGLRVKTLETRATPNHGIKSCIGNAVRVGMGTITFAIVVTAAASWYVPALFPFVPSFWLMTGFVALWYGLQDAGYHGTLRALLAWSRNAPWRFAHFLDHATKLIFLKRVGGGYIFIHRMLLEHFAAMTVEAKASGR